MDDLLIGGNEDDRCGGGFLSLLRVEGDATEIEKGPGRGMKEREGGICFGMGSAVEPETMGGASHER